MALVVVLVVIALGCLMVGVAYGSDMSHAKNVDPEPLTSRGWEQWDLSHATKDSDDHDAYVNGIIKRSLSS